MDTTYPDLEPIWPGWKIEELLEKGLGGTVYKTTRSMNGIVMESAVKIAATPKEQYFSAHLQGEDIQNFELYKSKADDGIAEISCLLKLKSCNHVVNIEDFALVKRADDIGWDVFIRLELLRTLKDYLKDKQRLDEEEIIKLGLDLSDALIYCEKNGIVHRDIKLDNILITEDGCFKLSDFGIAIMLEAAGTASKKGNKNYMAPEMYLERKYGKTTDTYSLGILMYLLANGNKMPFFDSEYFEADNEEKEQAFNRRIHGENIPDTCCASKELNRIILKACSYDPEKRYPNAEALYKDLKGLENRQDRKR